jgi:hypothetical protein
MKFCKECDVSPWPFALVTSIAGMIAFLTWLTMGLSEPDPMLRLGAGVAVFVAVEGTLVHYVISCLRRHCRHRTARISADSTFHNSRA